MGLASRHASPAVESESTVAGAASIALYRYRYDISGPSPLGDAKSIRTPEQAAEHRVAQAALARLRRLTKRADAPYRRSAPRIDQGRGL